MRKTLRFELFWSRVLLTFLCMTFGVRLMFPSQEILSLYAGWGFSLPFLVFLGALQVGIGIALWMRNLIRKIALLALWAIVCAALTTHVLQSNPWWMLLPGIAVGALVWLELLKLGRFSSVRTQKN